MGHITRNLPELGLQQLATRKMYIDSRQDKGARSDFAPTLNQSVQVPENTVAYIDDVILPNTIMTTDAALCYIYTRETYSGSPCRLGLRSRMAITLEWTWRARCGLP